MTTRNTQRANNGLTCLIAPCCLDREYEIRRLFIAYAETLEEWDEMLKIDPEANPDILSDASQEFVKNECGRIFNLFKHLNVWIDRSDEGQYRDERQNVDLVFYHGTEQPEYGYT